MKFNFDNKAKCPHFKHFECTLYSKTKHNIYIECYRHAKIFRFDTPEQAEKFFTDHCCKEDGNNCKQFHEINFLKDNPCTGCKFENGCYKTITQCSKWLQWFYKEWKKIQKTLKRG